jgi:hypothetical protein
MLAALAWLAFIGHTLAIPHIGQCLKSKGTTKTFKTIEKVCNEPQGLRKKFKNVLLFVDTTTKCVECGGEIHKSRKVMLECPIKHTV